MSRLLCIYGSVTGKAQSIAEQIVESAHSKNIEVDLQCFSEHGKGWSVETARRLIIVSSTTGDGEQPETVTKFWRKLRPRNLPADHLSQLQYTVLGLGDTNYNQFCNGPKNLHRRLTELGACLFYQPGWADDGTGLELVVEPWIEGLWTAIEAMPGFVKGGGPEATEDFIDGIDDTNAENMCDIDKKLGDVNLVNSLRFSSALNSASLSLPPCPKPYISVTNSDASPATDCPHQNNAPLPSAAGPVRSGSVVSVKTLTAEDAVKKYIEVRLEMKGDDVFLYEPGDAVSVICHNRQDEVDRLCQLLGVVDKQHQACRIYLNPETEKQKAKLPAFLSQNSSLNELFLTCCDFRAVPKKTLLRALVDQTTDSGEKRRLQELCSKQGGDEYMKYIRECSLSLLDLLTEFPSCHPSPTLLLEHLPRLLPRPYSLTSSRRVDERTLSFVLSVVRDPRPGLASTWLESLMPGQEVRLFPRSNCHFRPPESLSTPYIMVGAGTGVAPFLGFLADRAARLTEAQLSVAKAGETRLFFGCRNKDKDYIYREQLEDFHEKKLLTNLNVSFSRDDASETGRYVQHEMDKAGSDIWQLLEEKEAVLFVCGDAKNMAKDVNSMLVKIVANHGKIKESEAREYVAKLRLEKRYLEDIWT